MASISAVVEVSVLLLLLVVLLRVLLHVLLLVAAVGVHCSFSGVGYPLMNLLVLRFHVLGPIHVGSMLLRTVLFYVMVCVGERLIRVVVAQYRVVYCLVLDNPIDLLVVPVVVDFLHGGL